MPVAEGAEPTSLELKEAAADRFAELGQTGLRRWGGIIAEELLPELQGLRGMRVYRQMRENDPIVGAFLMAIKMLLRQADWSAEPGGPGAEDEKAAEFVDSCLNDMSHTWEEFLADCTSFLPYGWAMHETVYKQRRGEQPDGEDAPASSEYDDGLIGWRKLPIRSQDTLWQWVFDRNGGIRAMVQQVLGTTDAASGTFTIPIEKALLFRTEPDRGNPEGRSILRNAYQPWYFKKRYQISQGIGVERDLAGLPVLELPETVDFFANDPVVKKQLDAADRLVRRIRRDEMDGVVVPFGWKLSLLSATSRRSVDIEPIIQRLNREMAMTALADFILLGHESVGSFALASTKTDLFGLALAAWLDMIAAVFNRYAIPRLFRLNPSLRPKKLPKLVHGEVESPPLQEFADFLDKMIKDNVIHPGKAMEAWARKLAGLPSAEEDAPDPKEVAAREAMARQQAQPGQGAVPGGPGAKVPGGGSGDGTPQGGKDQQPAGGSGQQGGGATTAVVHLKIPATVRGGGAAPASAPVVAGAG
jgi:hypothetical protein